MQNRKISIISKKKFFYKQKNNALLLLSLIYFILNFIATSLYFLPINDIFYNKISNFPTERFRDYIVYGILGGVKLCHATKKSIKSAHHNIAALITQMSLFDIALVMATT